MTATTKALPRRSRLLNAVGKVTHAKSLRRFRFEEDAVMAQATQKTGLTDFGDPAFLRGLRALLGALELAWIGG